MGIGETGVTRGKAQAEEVRGYGDLTIVNLRFVYKVLVALVTLLAVIASNHPAAKNEGFFDLYLLGLVLVGLTYPLI